MPDNSLKKNMGQDVINFLLPSLTQGFLKASFFYF
jgi:hypothetical protein